MKSQATHSIKLFTIQIIKDLYPIQKTTRKRTNKQTKKTVENLVH